MKSTHGGDEETKDASDIECGGGSEHDSQYCTNPRVTDSGKGSKGVNGDKGDKGDRGDDGEGVHIEGNTGLIGSVSTDWQFLYNIEIWHERGEKYNKPV